MLIVVGIFFAIFLLGCVLSKVVTNRLIERMENELLQLAEEQRQTFQQMKQAKASLKTLELRREMAQQECLQLQNALFKTQAQLRAVAEASEKKKEQAHGHRSF